MSNNRRFMSIILYDLKISGKTIKTYLKIHRYIQYWISIQMMTKTICIDTLMCLI